MKLRVNPRALAVASVLMASLTWVNAQQRSGATVAIDPDDIGGVVTSSKGPEAGVWVIAETSELPTKFARMVVTDDQGRYVLPDLPRASYQVFVRGYGLVDSPRVPAKPGSISISKPSSRRMDAPPRRCIRQIIGASWRFPKEMCPT